MKTVVYLRNYSGSGDGIVWVRFYISGAKVNYSTKVRVAVSDWDAEHSCVKSSDPLAKDKNLVIDNEVADITKTEVRMRLLGRKPTRESFLRALHRPSDYTDFFEFCQAYAKKYGKMLRHSTASSERTALAKLSAYHPGLAFDEIDAELIGGFLAYLVSECGNNLNTANKNLSIVKKYVMAAVREGYMDVNPFDGWKMPKRTSAIVFLTEEELTRLIHIYNKGDLEYTAYRSLEVFLFLCMSSLHIGDARRLRIEQIGKDSFTYFRVKLETRNPQPITVPMSSGLSDITAHIIGNRKKGLVLGQCPTDQEMNRQLKRIAADAGIAKNISLKCGRHTFATLFASKTHDLLSLKSILGHSDIKDTLVYAHVIDDDKRAGVEAAFASFTFSK